MTRRRVVVTGMGIVAPVGIGVDAAWADILAGKSGITAITRFDASTFPSRIAGEVKNFDVSKWLSAKEARRYDTFIHYGLVASMEASATPGSTITPATRSAPACASARASAACR
jgi:3-oxoacyl-[acyl-carrier-protein] synthase II